MNTIELKRLRRLRNRSQQWWTEHVYGETIRGVVIRTNYSDGAEMAYTTVDVNLKPLRTDRRPVRIYFPGQAKDDRRCSIEFGGEYDFWLRAPVGNGMLSEPKFYSLHRENPQLRFGRHAVYHPPAPPLPGPTIARRGLRGYRR